MVERCTGILEKEVAMQGSLREAMAMMVLVMEDGR